MAGKSLKSPSVSESEMSYSGKCSSFSNNDMPECWHWSCSSWVVKYCI